MNTSKNNIRRLKYIWPYVLFSITIVLLILLNERTIRHEVNKNLDYARIINITGTQRVIAEKLANLCAQDVAGKDRKKEIVELTAFWRRTQTEIENGRYGIAKHAEQHLHITLLLDKVTAMSKLLDANLNNAGGNPISPELLMAVDNSVELYSDQMELLTNQLSKSAVADLNYTNTRQSIVALISGIILLLEIIIFIVPYHRRHLQAYKKMKEQQVQLEYDEFLLEESGRTAKVGGWDYDSATGDINWTEAMYDIHDIARSDGNKGSISERINAYAPEHRAHITEKLNRAVMYGEPFDFEAQMTTRKGNVKWIRSIATPVVNEVGEVEKVRGVYLDITQQKHRELELLSTKEKLADANKTKDILFSIIAHDLRGPIVNLQSLIAMKQDDIITRDEFMKYIEDVQMNISYLSDMMDNMLHWAQSQLKGFTINKKVVNLSEVLQETALFYQTALRYKNINMHIENNTYPLAYADYDHVMLIVRNLLNNAIKYTPQNGHIEVYISDSDSKIILNVVDSGSGIDAQTMKKLELREAVESTRGTEGEKGTGLGLSFCMDLAKINNGILSIQSTGNKGTHIALTLPKYEKDMQGIIA